MTQITIDTLLNKVTLIGALILSSCSSRWFCRPDNHALKTLGIKTELVAAAELLKLSYIKDALKSLQKNGISEDL